MEEYSVSKGSNDVYIPILNYNVTTLEDEIKWLRSLRHNMLVMTARSDRKITNKYNSTAEKILKMLCQESRKSLDDDSKRELLKKIDISIKENKPIPLSFTIAFGFRLPNYLKFQEPSNPPTLAWLYNIYKLSLIAEKVKRIYPAGVEFFIFEEAYLIKDLFRIQDGIIERNMKILQQMIVGLAAPVRVIDLKKEQFPKKELEELTVEISDADIFSIMCSLPEMKNEKIMGMLYTVRNKPYQIIKKEKKYIWNKAKGIAKVKNRYFAYRKKINLFQSILKKMEGNNIAERLIDATVTEKKGRLSFKFTGGSLFNHGATVIERKAQGKNKCYVVPEYKLRTGLYKNQSIRKHVKPIYIEIDGVLYIWAYEVQN
ncbi:hypothetical protein KAJ41_02030 [Candidatus Parcubacteria bacterium]|nr:hypothetical protein [Candidatus Parcubacteria bacterium]